MHIAQCFWFWRYSQNGRASPGLLLALIAAYFRCLLSDLLKSASRICLRLSGSVRSGTSCGKVWYKVWQGWGKGVTKVEILCSKVWYKVVKKSTIQVRVWYKV